MGSYLNFGRFGGAGFLTSEYLIVDDDSPAAARYIEINEGVPNELDSYGPSSTRNCNCTDGTFVFVHDGAGSTTSQRAWNGSALTQRFSGSLGGGNGPKCYYRVPGHDNYFLSQGDLGGADGLAINEYQTAATFSYAATAYEVVGDVWSVMMDFRVAEPETPVYGDTVVAAADTGRVLTFSGTTPTSHATLAMSSGRNIPNAWGWDRDTGLIANLTGTANATLDLYQLNMTTRGLTSIGTASTTGTVYAVECYKGFIITLEDNGASDIIRSYSRSGTTLTQVDSLTVGSGQSANSCLISSPYTGYVYSIGSAANAGRVLQIDDAGQITSLATHGWISSSGFGNRMCFLPAALPTV